MDRSYLLDDNESEDAVDEQIMMGKLPETARV